MVSSKDENVLARLNLLRAAASGRPAGASWISLDTRLAEAFEVEQAAAAFRSLGTAGGDRATSWIQRGEYRLIGRRLDSATKGGVHKTDALFHNGAILGFLTAVAVDLAPTVLSRKEAGLPWWVSGLPALHIACIGRSLTGAVNGAELLRYAVDQASRNRLWCLTLVPIDVPMHDHWCRLGFAPSGTTVRQPQPDGSFIDVPRLWFPLIGPRDFSGMARYVPCDHSRGLPGSQRAKLAGA